MGPCGGHLEVEGPRGCSVGMPSQTSRRFDWVTWGHVTERTINTGTLPEAENDDESVMKEDVTGEPTVPCRDLSVKESQEPSQVRSDSLCIGLEVCLYYNRVCCLRGPVVGRSVCTQVIIVDCGGW